MKTDLTGCSRETLGCSLGITLTSKHCTFLFLFPYAYTWMWWLNKKVREGKGTQRSHPSNAENVDERERELQRWVEGRWEERGRRKEGIITLSLALRPSSGFLIRNSQQLPRLCHLSPPCHGHVRWVPPRGAQTASKKTANFISGSSKILAPPGGKFKIWKLFLSH